MPKIITNDDGTRSLTLDTGELTLVTGFLGEQAPRLRKALDMVEGHQIRVTLDLVRARNRIGGGEAE